MASDATDLNGPPGARPAGWRDRDGEVSRHLDLDLLSAYIDDQLDAAARAEATAHLGVCAACRADLAETEAVVDLLRTLPQFSPGRSFALEPRHLQQGRGHDWFAPMLDFLPALRLATVAVAALLVMVTAGDIVSTHRAAPPAGGAVGIVAPRGFAPAAGTGVPAAASFEMNAATEPSAALAARSQAAAPSADETAPAPAAAPAPAPAPEAAPAAAGGPSRWRLAQVGLALALAWMLVTLVGLSAVQRMRHPPER